MNTLTGNSISATLSGLSVLLEYPSQPNLEAAQAWCRQPQTIAAGEIAQFASESAEMPASDLEEIYTRTFDMAPLCVPYITSYLYGAENYERGNLMTMLSERYKQDSFDIGGELPDHLGVILKFFPHFTDEERAEITRYCLLDPVEQMWTSIKDQQSNPYRHVLAAVLAVLKTV